MVGYVAKRVGLRVFESRSAKPSLGDELQDKDCLAMTTAAIEALRASLHATIDAVCNDAITQLSADLTPKSVKYKFPTLADGHDPRNKNGLNLTPRGAEILYRVFDEGGGYNRAAKMLNITQAAAKNRKAMWAKLGGQDRAREALDIDTIG